MNTSLTHWPFFCSGEIWENRHQLDISKRYKMQDTDRAQHPLISTACSSCEEHLACAECLTFQNWMLKPPNANQNYYNNSFCRLKNLNQHTPPIFFLRNLVNYKVPLAPMKHWDAVWITGLDAIISADVTDPSWRSKCLSIPPTHRVLKGRTFTLKKCFRQSSRYLCL